MASQAPHVMLHDCQPSQDLGRDEVLQGLQQEWKTIPCKFLYDARGSALFDQICTLPEYYPTRTELAIMHRHGPAMASLLGPDCLLVEYGSGSSTKTRVLLDHLEDPAAYVPIDISREHLLGSATALAEVYAPLEVLPVCADYTQPFTLPAPRRAPARTAVYFPGSTIGNFHPEQARAFLREIGGLCGSHGGLLLGVDLRKEPQILEPAYNDREGVTAAFNLNLLHRLNRELGMDFAVDRFEHYAFFNPFPGRIEMHLLSIEAQTVHLGDAQIVLEADESIRTECSYKYSLEGFAGLAASAGWQVQHVWTDPACWFSVQYLIPA